MDNLNDELLSLFMQKLGMDKEAAAVFVREGFSSLEEIAYVSLSELLSLPGLSEPQLQEWRRLAREQLLSQEIRQEPRDDDEDADQEAIVPKPNRPLSGGAAAQVDDTDFRSPDSA